MTYSTFFSVNLFWNWLFGRLFFFFLVFLELILQIPLGLSLCLEGHQSPACWSNRRTNLWRDRKSTSMYQVGVWQQTVVCLIFSPTYSRRKDIYFPVFFFYIKKIPSWHWTLSLQHEKHHEHDCQKLSTQQSALLPSCAKTGRALGSAFKSENKFMGDQPSSCIQFLTATIFSKYSICFLVTEHFILLSSKAPSVSKGKELIKATCSWGSDNIL